MMKKQGIGRAVLRAGLWASVGGMLGLPALSAGQTGNGPVRLARFSSIKGNVEWRPEPGAHWSAAVVNLPLRDGAQIWTPGASRAEIIFDDGSVMRLASGAVVTFAAFDSDSHGEFSDIHLNQGRAYLHLRHGYSIYQIDTPEGSVKADGPARLRLAVGNGLKAAVLNGQAVVENDRGDTTVRAQRLAYVGGPNNPVAIKTVPAPDPWDRYNDQRDIVVFHHNRYLPSNIDLVSEDLDDYGVWDRDPRYGYVWMPRESDPDWRPYYHGHWTWVSPFGWTWVGDEPWGWAPYHYGTWVHRHFRNHWGWGWAPGPAAQYWSPAVVDYTYYGDDVAWAPLDPDEVRYPRELPNPFAAVDWALLFSIGSAACYYPADPHYCAPRPWDNAYVNRVTNVYYGAPAMSFYSGPVVNGRFVPANSRYGAIYTSANGFRGSGRFQPVRGNGSAPFQRGQWRLASNRGAPVFGPATVRPGGQSYAPRRTFARQAPDPAAFRRPVFQPRGAMANRAPAGRPGFANRPGFGNRPGVANRAVANRPGMNRPNVNRPGANRSVANRARPNAGRALPWNPNRRVSPAQAMANARRSLNWNSRKQGLPPGRRAGPNVAARRPGNAGRPGAAGRPTTGAAAHRFAQANHPTPRQPAAHGAAPHPSAAHRANQHPGVVPMARRANANQNRIARAQSHRAPAHRSPTRSPARRSSVHRAQARPAHRSAPRSTPRRSFAAPRRSRPAPHFSAPRRSAPRRSEPMRRAPMRSAPRNTFRPAPRRSMPHFGGGGRPASRPSFHPAPPRRQGPPPNRGGGNRGGGNHGGGNRGGGRRH